MKNITNSSIVVQWDAVDDSLYTVYTVTWTDERDLFEVATVDEQTSYTITGLILDTVYTIHVNVANRCGDGPEFRTRIFFSTNTTSHYTSTISTSSNTAVTHPTTTTTAMINLSTTTTNSMTTVFSEDTGTTTKTTPTSGLGATTTTATVIKGFST